MLWTALLSTDLVLHGNCSVQLLFSMDIILFSGFYSLQIFARYVWHTCVPIHVAHMRPDPCGTHACAGFKNKLVLILIKGMRARMPCTSPPACHNCRPCSPKDQRRPLSLVRRVRARVRPRRPARQAVVVRVLYNPLYITLYNPNAVCFVPHLVFYEVV